MHAKPSFAHRLQAAKMADSRTRAQNDFTLRDSSCACIYKGKYRSSSSSDTRTVRPVRFGL